MQHKALLDGTKDASNWYEIVSGNYVFYTGYAAEPILEQDIGTISNNQITIGDQQCTLLCLMDADEPDIYTLFALDKLIDFDAYPVYFKKQDDTRVFTIERVYADYQQYGYVMYLLTPHDHLFNQDYNTVPEHHTVWISTTYPPSS